MKAVRFISLHKWNEAIVNNFLRINFFASNYTDGLVCVSYSSFRFLSLEQKTKTESNFISHQREMSESIKICKDWVRRAEQMDDTTAGQFAKSIFALANGFEPPENPELRFLLGEVRRFYTAEEEKKQAISEKRKLAGKNGGLAKA